MRAGHVLRMAGCASALALVLVTGCASAQAAQTAVTRHLPPTTAVVEQPEPGAASKPPPAGPDAAEAPPTASTPTPEPTSRKQGASPVKW